MSYIIVSRNPGNNKLLVIQDEHEAVTEFVTEYEALCAADQIPICRAWGFDAVEIDR